MRANPLLSLRCVTAALRRLPRSLSLETNCYANKMTGEAVGLVANCQIKIVIEFRAEVEDICQGLS
ncbi:uncharacterized protein G2W53_033997 [Senna tora]|uniref:Uncharacterized protein n=1 Tax=Senna tora TaxID=362788 RepID=A0A834WBH6_9FABA|nr:uncharacterized protein G2W53_033997 [Senna tora]